VTLPILLVARSRCPDRDSNFHRTTYPSPPLRSAQAAQEGQFILRGGGPSDYKIVVSCCTTITASNLTLAPGSKEDTATCREFFQDMRRRGLPDPLLVISDGAPGLFRAIEDDLSPPTQPTLCRSWAESAVAAGIRAGLVASLPSQPSDGRMTQNITPLWGPTCLGAQT
jgi:Transposase, Mutator family